MSTATLVPARILLVALATLSVLGLLLTGAYALITLDAPWDAAWVQARVRPGQDGGAALGLGPTAQVAAVWVEAGGRLLPGRTEHLMSAGAPFLVVALVLGTVAVLSLQLLRGRPIRPATGAWLVMLSLVMGLAAVLGPWLRVRGERLFLIASGVPLLAEDVQRAGMPAPPVDRVVAGGADLGRTLVVLPVWSLADSAWVLLVLAVLTLVTAFLVQRGRRFQEDSEGLI